MRIVPPLVALFVFGAIAFAQDVATKISEAATSGDIAATRALVDANGGANSLAGGTALLQAIVAAKFELVENLLAAGADPNRRSIDGHLPLLIAVGNHDFRIVETLLRHGVDPNGIGRCLEPDCPTHPALVFAAYLTEPVLVKQLLDAGADASWGQHGAANYANLNCDTESLKLLRAAAGRENAGAPPKEAAPVAKQSVSALGLTELLPASPERKLLPAPTGKCRLAVIADAALAAPADLLTARLSQDAGFEVLERAELDRILREQSLSSSIAEDPAGAVKVGALLGADALILVQKIVIGGNALVQARFVRVHPGLILDTNHAVHPLAAPAPWADSLAQRIAPLARKAIARDAMALSIVGWRTSVPTTTGGELERAAGLLLTDRLVREPQLHLLERVAIDALTREHALGTEGEFWAGSWLLDGVVEPAPDRSGRLSLILRLQPAKPGETITITVQGTRAKLVEAVSDAVAQITQALTRQPATPASDFAVEAQRYLDEAKNAVSCRMFLAAHRAAETAWMLGEPTFEAAQLRVLSGVRTLQWQYECMAGRDSFPGREPVRGRAWTAKWLNDRLAGQPWLGPKEFIDLAIDNAGAWRDGLAKLEAEPGRAEEYFQLLNDFIGSSVLTFMIFDTAAGELDYGAQLNELREATRTALDETELRASQYPGATRAQNALAEGRMYLARVFYPNDAAAIPALRNLLAKHFPEKDASTRAKIRELIGALDSSANWSQLRLDSARNEISWLPIPVRMPGGQALRRAVIEHLMASGAPEDEFAARYLSFRYASSSAEKRAHSRRMFELVWEMRDFLASDPKAVASLEKQFFALGRDPEAPQFAQERFKKDPADNDYSMRDNEGFRALKVRLETYLLQHAPLDAGWTSLSFSRPATPEEEKARRAAMDERTLKKGGASPTRSAPRQGRRNTTSFEGSPPLQVTQVWHPYDLAPDETYDFDLKFDTLTVKADCGWVYGVFTPGYLRTSPAYGCVFRIEIPSLKTTKIALPKTPQKSSDGTDSDATWLAVSETHLFCGLENRCLAIYDCAAQRWEINEEIKPHGTAILLGDDCFQMTRWRGVDGLVRLNPARHSAELLASSQRTPAATPLDDPTLEFKSMALSPAGGELWITANERRPLSGPGASELRSTAKTATFAFSPQTGTWRTATAWHDFSPNVTIVYGETLGRVYTPYGGPNPSLLHLFLPGYQRVTLPLEFKVPQQLAAREVHPHRLGASKCISTKQGHFFPSWPERVMWFLPSADLEAYMHAHPPSQTPDTSTPPGR
ncbi:MAG: hypothetical protein QOE70_5183 [Chthoniobacter sp.]|jgi:ankyrin repeat protein|nr:hypothetical protein [Chthoniobacter sp.]